jgi:hypothetical protein
MIFKMYNCDFGIKYGGVSYDFGHVDKIEIEDPEMNKLIRGQNASDQVGLVYTEGTKDPKKVTTTLLGISQDLSGLMKTIFETKARCEVYCIDRTDGSSKIGKDCVLSQRPQQLTVDGSPESMNVLCIFETFNLSEDHKS